MPNSHKGSELIPTPSPASRPTALRVLIAVLACEILVLIVAGGFAGFEMTRPNATISADLFLLALAWGLALILFYAGRGLLRGQRWARSPVMTWQLFQIVIAVSWLTTSVHIGALLLLASGLTIAFCLMTKGVVAATTRDARAVDTEDDDGDS